VVLEFHTDNSGDDNDVDVDSVVADICTRRMNQPCCHGYS
jgi:hypothetical protein